MMKIQKHCYDGNAKTSIHGKIMMAIVTKFYWKFLNIWYRVGAAVIFFFTNYVMLCFKTIIR